MKVKIINNSNNPLPTFQTENAAGVDLYANNPGPITLQSLERKLIPTGVFLELPEGMEAQIRPRSGLAYKHGITVLNSPGTIDADYRGEIGVLLVNLSTEEYTVNRGERVAQMVIAEYKKVIFEEVSSLKESDRGAGGFGSTGSK